MATKQADVVAKTQEQIFDLYTKSQDAVVNGLGTWADAAREMTGAVTSIVDSAMIDSKVFESVVDQTFAGATKMLDQQRDFVKKLQGLTGNVTETAA